MSTNHTPNYALSQWEAGDQVLRADFNADNAKIDAALAALAAKDTEIETGALQMAVGQYWGTGEPSHKVELPFKAKFMWIQVSTMGDDEHMALMGINASFYQPGKSPSAINSLGGFETENTDTGVTTKATCTGSVAELARIALNTTDRCYLYVAFG